MTKSKSYNKYRTFYLPTQMVDLLFLNSHLIPIEDRTQSQSIEIGLSAINDILSKSDMFYKDKNKNYPYHVIPMSSNYLKMKYGNDYAIFMHWLVIYGVVWDDSPSEGYATHYYLHDIPICQRIINSRIKEWGIKPEEIITPYCLQNNTKITAQSIDNNGISEGTKNRIFCDWYKIKIPIRKQNKSYLTKNYEEDSKYINNASEHIGKMGSHYRKTLDIDYDGAMQFVNKGYFKEITEAQTIDKEKVAYRRYSSRVASLNALKNGRINKSLRFNRNDTNNRLDTNLTNMASELRQFIIGYKDMAYLDLVNSQPVLFNVLLSKYRKNASIEQLKELDTYLLSTTNGIWYEELEKIYNVSRNEAKEIWMEIAYSENSSYVKRKKKFSESFPFISKIIEELKIKNHADFSIELQKIESVVFIDKICKDLVAAGIVPFTIHDGLLVPKNSWKKTEFIMLENLKKVIGAYPKIKVYLPS